MSYGLVNMRYGPKRWYLASQNKSIRCDYIYYYITLQKIQGEKLGLDRAWDLSNKSANKFEEWMTVVPAESGAFEYPVRIAIIALNGFLRTPRISQKTETVW